MSKLIPLSELPDEMSLEDYLEWYAASGGNAAARVSKGKGKIKEASTDWGKVLIDQLALAGKPLPTREHIFHPKRKWRLDLAWVDRLIAVEIDGGLFARPVVCHNCKQTVKRLVNGKWVVVREGGRHNTGSGRANDIEKTNEAQLLGWHIYHVTPAQVESMAALELLMRVLA